MTIRGTKFIILSALTIGFNFDFSVASSKDGAAALCGSGDWLVYSDTKCLKLVSTPLTYDEALTACDLEAAGREPQPILTVNSLEEQNGIAALLFKELGIVDNVWLAATRSSNPSLGFVWLDGSPLEFNSWAPGSPSNDLQKNCSQVSSQLSRNNNGEWRDVSCNVWNLALCQKEQQWSSAQLRATILQQRKENRDALLKLRKDHETHVAAYGALLADHNTLKAAHNSLQANPVPVGFLYIEYSGQSTPKTIWPALTWTDVSSQFAGLFFRVVGGAAGGFGTIQDGDSPRLTTMHAQYGGAWLSDVKVTPGEWSPLINTGDNKGSAMGTRFFVSNPEVRPRNSAVRIWKRTA